MSVTTNNLCQITVATLEAGMPFPEHMLANAGAEYAAAREHSRNQDDTQFWHNGIAMCFTTTLVVLEQLFRHQHRVDVLAEQVAGEFGRMLTRMQIAASGKSKRITKHTRGYADDRRKTGKRRTKCGVTRNMWELEELVHETAQCVLFGAVDELRILAPSYWEGVPVEGKGRHQYKTMELFGRTVRVRDENNKPICTGVIATTNRVFVCLDVASRREVRLVAQMTGPEYHMLNKIIQHNTACSDAGDLNRIQYISTNTEHCTTLCKRYGSDIRKINRVLTTLSRAHAGCVWTAFAASMARIMSLEFGKSHKVHELLQMSHEEKMSTGHIDMVPVDFADEIAAKCTPLQKAILEIDVETVDIENRKSREGLDEMLWRLNNRLENPISRATFFRNRKAILEIAEAVTKHVE